VTQLPASAMVSGGKTRVAGGGSPSGPEGAGERQPVRVLPEICCYGMHQPADRVVHAQVSVDLLDHAVGQFGPQDHAGSALMGLELAERRLDLPALGIKLGEVVRWCGLRVGDGGQQPVGSGPGVRFGRVLRSGDGGG